MIKFIGLIIIAFGLLLLAITLIAAKRGGLSEAKSELSLILESGYADTHKEAKKGARIQERLNVPDEIKVAPKKRTLSKEAKEILAMVEKEKAAEKEGSENSQARKPGKITDNTDILHKRKAAGSDGSTDVLERGKTQGEASKKEVTMSTDDGTDLLQRMKMGEDTDVMKRDSADSTDILHRKTSPTHNESTGILPKKQQAGDSTDVLKKDSFKQEATDVLERKSKKQEDTTGILDRERIKKSDDATDVLIRKDTSCKSGDAASDATDILERRK